MLWAHTFDYFRCLHRQVHEGTLLRVPLGYFVISRGIGKDMIIGVSIRGMDVDNSEMFFKMASEYQSFGHADPNLLALWRAYASMMAEVGVTGDQHKSFMGDKIVSNVVDDKAIVAPIPLAAPPAPAAPAAPAAPVASQAIKPHPTAAKASNLQPPSKKSRIEAPGVCDHGATVAAPKCIGSGGDSAGTSAGTSTASAGSGNPNQGVRPKAGGKK